jgi:hypothetical protein
VSGTAQNCHQNCHQDAIRGVRSGRRVSARQVRQFGASQHSRELGLEAKHFGSKVFEASAEQGASYWGFQTYSDNSRSPNR